MSLLRMENISKKFFDVYVNKDINLSVERCEVHALLGENGAGKTTLMNILFGIYKPDGGEIFIEDKKVSLKSPRDAIENGIGMVFQHFSLIKNMTVVDNIILGLSDNSFIIDRKSAALKIEELSKRYHLAVDPYKKVSSLSVGECQRVEILKALYRDVRVLILDEPTAVLTPIEIKGFFGVLKALASEGMGIILITHKMNEILEITDKVSVLRDGVKVAELETAKTNPEELSKHMLGRELNTDYNFETVSTEKEAVLKINNVGYVRRRRKTRVLENISFELFGGEILGIAGVDGSGQKELCEIIAGVRRRYEGEVVYIGENIDKHRAKERFKRGISYISDDRQNDGLIGDMSVSDNILLRVYNKKPYAKYSVMRRTEIMKKTDKAIDKYKIKTSGTGGGSVYAKMLSGGNQQKIIIAREIRKYSKVVIAAQPTRGLDMGATEVVRKRLVDHRNAGNSVILVSADLEEILALSDRVAVIEGGKIEKILNRDEANLTTIGLLMGGAFVEEGV